MYRKILLAYDGSTEGRRALREGAALALRCNAEVFLLAVIDNSASLATAEGAYAQVIGEEQIAYQAVLDEGVQRLRALGFAPEFRLGWGRPGEVIVSVAKEIGADLVVAGHRRKGTFASWWSELGRHLRDQAHRLQRADRPDRIQRRAVRQDHRRRTGRPRRRSASKWRR